MSLGTAREKDGRLLFADEQLELSCDRSTGRWLALRDVQGGATLLDHGAQEAPVILRVNGTTTATKGRAHCWSVVDAEVIGLKTTCTGFSCREDERGTTLTLHTEEGDWLLDQHYTLVRGAARVERGLSIAYRGEGTALLREIELRLPPAALGPVAECFVEAPCYPTRARQPLAHLPLGEYWDRVVTPVGNGAPGWLPGLLGLHNPARELALAAWIFTEDETATLAVMREDRGTRIGHAVLLADRFAPGHRLAWRGQYVQAFHRPWLEALREWQSWYDEIGYFATPDRPAWAHSARIYELFVGHAPERSVNKYPDMDALAADLPRIKELGFDTLQIMPHMPFPSYSVVDYHDVGLHYGSAEGLRRVVARAHALGIKVLLDVILHGVMDGEAVAALREAMGASWLDDGRLPARHPYRVQHPGWFMQTEFGTSSATYTWAFDHANEGWRDFMVEVFTYYVREFDVDGFRVDALAWMPFPNWAEGLPYHASASICGSRELSERVRRAVQCVKPEAVLYTETPGALFMRAYDLVYNYDMQWLFSGLVTPISPRGYAYAMAFATERIRAADVGLWLAGQRLAKPRGAMTVQHLDSHDSNEWGGLMQYRREAFGERAARALFGFCCALGGPLMVFMGAEDGAEAFYQQMLRLVNEVPALRDGDADYLAVRADNPDVFAPLRVHGTEVVVPVVHLADRAAQVTLALPVARAPFTAEAYRIVDLMDGRPLPGPDGGLWRRDQLAHLPLDLGPYQVRMLELVPA